MDNKQMDLLDFLDRINNLALKKGASECDSLIIDNSNNQVTIRNNKLEQSESSREKAFGIRVIVGKKQSMISSTDFNDDNINLIVDKAINMAKLSPDDPFIGLCDPENIDENNTDLDLYDDTELEHDKLVELAKATEEYALSSENITNSEGAECSQGKSIFAIANSKGFRTSMKSSRFSLGVSAIASSSNGMEVDYDYSVVRHFEDLKSPEKIGKEAARRAASKLNPKKIPSTEASIIYPRRMSSSLLGEFASAINGAAIARNTSFLKDMMGKEIFSKHINIVDDPLIKRGQKSRFFDVEGLKARKTTLVNNGVLSSWILDLRSSRQLGLDSTAHASRGIASAPYPSNSNLYMENGEISEEDLIKSVKKGLIITDLFGGGVNLLTGDYSQGAAGLWIENGEIQYAVSEITIASNLIDMFKMMVPANNLTMEYSINSPSILIEKMTIAGA